MNVLLDTCTYLWLTEDQEKLPVEVIQLIQNPLSKIHLSPVTIWEILVKIQKNKLKVTGDILKTINSSLKSEHITSLPFTPEDALNVTNLPLIHKDPYDRMLICQALTHNLTILTPDPFITQYPVKTLW